LRNADTADVVNGVTFCGVLNFRVDVSEFDMGDGVAMEGGLNDFGLSGVRKVLDAAGFWDAGVIGSGGVTSVTVFSFGAGVTKVSFRAVTGFEEFGVNIGDLNGRRPVDRAGVFMAFAGIVGLTL
jgi:hypothetical protein